VSCVSSSVCMIGFFGGCCVMVLFLCLLLLLLLCGDICIYILRVGIFLKKSFCWVVRGRGDFRTSLYSICSV